MARRVITNRYQTVTEPTPWLLIAVTVMAYVMAILRLPEQSAATAEPLFFFRLASLAKGALPLWGEVATATALTGLTAFSLDCINRYFSTGSDFRLPLVYALIVFSSPETLRLSPLHIAAPITAWALIYFAKCRTEGIENGNLWCAAAAGAAASFLWPPIIWAVIIATLTISATSDDKIRSTVAGIFAIALTVASGAAYDFVTSGGEAAAESLRLYFAAASDPALPSALEWGIPLILNIIIFTASLFSIVTFLGNKGKYRTSEAKMYSVALQLMTASLPVIAFFHIGSYPISSLPFISAPAILIFYIRKRDGGTALFNLILLLLAAAIICEFALSR